jgi:hypothetical protein
MKILLTLLFFLPITAHAGLLDLLPLKAIERKMIYPLSPEHVDPTRLGLPNTTEHRIDHPSASIVVWSVPATGKSRATVLYFHGNAGNLALRAERFKQMQAQGFDVLAMSYRGSSGSTGVPSETAITNDALHLYLNAGKYVPLRAPRNLILYRREPWQRSRNCAFGKVKRSSTPLRRDPRSPLHVDPGYGARSH